MLLRIPCRSTRHKHCRISFPKIFFELTPFSRVPLRSRSVSLHSDRLTQDKKEMAQLPFSQIFLPLRCRQTSAMPKH